MVQHVTLNMTIDSNTNVTSNEVEQLIQEATSQSVVATSTRPQRASKARAMMKIQDIHAWENCSENSKRFKEVEEAINAEFDALHPEERDVLDNDDDDESEYSQESEDSQDNLSFVDPDSDTVDDAASWSAAESEPTSESEKSDDESESDDDSTESMPVPESDHFDAFNVASEMEQANSWADSVMDMESPVNSRKRKNPFNNDDLNLS